MGKWVKIVLIISYIVVMIFGRLKKYNVYYGAESGKCKKNNVFFECELDNLMV